MITIYVIFHLTFDDTNVFTTDEGKIEEIIQRLSKKYENTVGEWRWRKIVEEEEFDAEMNDVPLFS
jgi:hypothetical protein